MDDKNKKQPVDAKDFSFFTTPADLLDLGLNEVAYIKRYAMNGQVAFVVHAANGTALAVQRDARAAEQSAAFQNLGVVSIH